MLPRLFCPLCLPDSPVPPMNHLVKFLPHVRASQPRPSGPQRPGLLTLVGKLGAAYRLALIFLFISRLVCLGGCFSPSTRGRRVHISSCFHADPDASAGHTAWPSEESVGGI